MVMADDENSDFVPNAAEQKALSRKWSSVVRGWGDRLVLLSLVAARGKDSSENRKEQCI
jgi:hypothetical protein